MRARGDWTCELMESPKETQAHHCATLGPQTIEDQTGCLKLGVMLPQSLGLLRTVFARNLYSLLRQQMGQTLYLLRSAVQSQTQHLQKAECLQAERESEMG